jgi:hypothetical protein
MYVLGWRLYSGAGDMPNMCITEIVTNVTNGSILAIHGPRNSGKHHYLKSELEYDGPVQGPRSLGELSESDGRWACTTEWELGANDLNDIFYNPRVKWYFRPNSTLAHFTAL